MEFTKVNLKIKYRSSDDDLVRDFYVPVLKKAKVYKRAVGYFSSSSLIQVSKGICGLVKSGGKIQIVASPRLQEQDIEAINQGYQTREKVIEGVLLDSLSKPKDLFEEARLNLLAHLIAYGQLDIKLAFLEKDNKVGLYHEKIGVLHDWVGNKIAFTGSLNESFNAFYENFESIDVFFSWRGHGDIERIGEKEKDFEDLWNNQTEKVQVVDFPEVVKERLAAYMKPEVDFDIDDKEFLVKDNYKVARNYPAMPETVKLYDYQEQAIKEWEHKGFKGIFNMATGTGKTITGLAAIAKLSEKLKGKIAVIIICPFQHLVEQWVEDIRLFNMTPIIGYSASTQKDWKKKLKDSVIDYNLGVINHFCFVTTNATFVSEYVQGLIYKLKKDAVILVDEAHNFGALNLSRYLNDKIPYRLALSATLDRHGDPEGTQKLYDYFGEECINYLLDRAIKEKKLTPYYYYPILTWLSGDELDRYKQLSVQLAKCYSEDDGGRKKLNDLGKKIAIKRARLVAGSINKLSALEEAIVPYKNSSHLLVYCGATTISDVDYIEGKADDSELRQISLVADLLGNNRGMKVSQFTSKETAREREILKREFAEGKSLQALIAIRCLDEGVNIPRIRTAFILASSTNPKEYIQRRGRVLRISEGKEYAIIYDFITMPRPLDIIKSLSVNEVKFDISLARKEISRMQDFADLSLNPQDAYKLISKIKEVYDLDKIGGDTYE